MSASRGRVVLLLLCACAACAAAQPRPVPAPRGPYLWRAATGGQIRSRPAVSPDGIVYALAEDNYLYAWVAGGSLAWKHDLGWIPWDCLAVSDDGTIYAGLKNAELLAVNPRGGRMWTVLLDGLPSGDPAVAADGTVLVGTAAGTLAAFSHLGRREWSVTLPGAVLGPPVIDGSGTVYVVAADHRLYALTPWGDFKWSLPLPSAPRSPAVAADGTLVVGTDGGDVVAVSPAGDARWTRRLGAAVVGVVASRDEIVAEGADGRLAAYAVDGRELWQAAAGRAVSTAPLVEAAGLVVIATDGSVFTIDPRHRASEPLRTSAAGGATLAPDGSILVGGRDWIVYALDPAAVGLTGGDSPAGAPWPQAGANGGHTGRTDASATSDLEALLNANPDYLYLRGLLSISGRDGIQLVLSEVAARVTSHRLGKSGWYTARILDGLVGTGTVTQVRQNQKLMNDFPDLRAQAAALLGRVGTTGSRAALLAAARAETDPVARAEELRALGAISSDGDGQSLALITRTFMTQTARSGPDERLATAVVDAIGRISVYEGTLTDTEAIQVLIAIDSGGYEPDTRAAADSILHGDLKAYILNVGGAAP